MNVNNNSGTIELSRKEMATVAGGGFFTGLGRIIGSFIGAEIGSAIAVVIIFDICSNTCCRSVANHSNIKSSNSKNLPSISFAVNFARVTIISILVGGGYYLGGAICSKIGRITDYVWQKIDEI